MHLIHILLPVADNAGKPFRRPLFRTVATELTERFGGVTAYTRAPAEGLWAENGDGATKDEIVTYEVMAEALDEAWWRAYRRRLERRFRQDRVVIRAVEMRLL